MKSVISLFIVLVCAPLLYADDLENIMRAAASFENHAIDLKTAAETTIFASPCPTMPEAKEDFTFKYKFCWARGKNANAERMGMAYSFCIDSLKVTAGIRENPKLNVEGDVLNGSFDLKISQPSDGLYKATAVIFKREPLIQVCASAEAAYIELSLLIDERGKIVSDPEIKSFYGKTSDTCGSSWNYREIKYALKGE
ncbi:MAG: hypothetical protein A2270_01375 [Elusimicrobia bacterium RIFOXYA12_FULL_51_18]|nr:MAG: hypothetical protein A2270_01375 [Elusimicrobia bacterium RIFOXYA12_FULL_51_18]OGS30019.1 MAG: hypothetical protein A2218_12770 [Elusimicrobia bacterium RIFOXYA2_FULL_53_38]